MTIFVVFICILTKRPLTRKESLQYINWVWLLFTNPRARVCANKHTSDVFSLQRGTRWGCPLSLLFALEIEPLALAVWQTAMGICYGKSSEKISLYVDDALIYLDGSEQSFVYLMRVVDEFGKVSGLRVGWEKSVIFPIGPKLNYDYLLRSKLEI